jgi:predicted RNA-binding protein YlxR (DUF448 family)
VAVEELVRFHRTPNGLEPGPGPGRGAWLCRAHPGPCLDEARRRRTVDRALRIPIRDDDIEQLRARLVAGVVPTNGETGEVCNTQ